MTVKHCRSTQVETSHVGDRVILFDRGSLKSLVLNPSGARVWDMLCEPQTNEELAAQLVSHFSGLPMEQATNDLTTYLDALVDQGVVVVQQ